MSTAMAIAKRSNITQITNKAGSAGLGWVGGRAYVNGGSLRALALDPSYGNQYFVSASGGDDSNAGESPANAFATIQAAVTAAVAGDTIFIAPGEYDEAVTLPRTKSALTLIGMGPRGSVGIAPSTAAAVGLTSHGAYNVLINIGVAGETTAAYACRVTAALRAYACKFEGADTNGAAFGFGPGSVIQEAAGTHGRGGDLLLEDCEFAWTYDGLNFVASDYGAATQILVTACRFHNCSHSCITGVPGAFGIGSVRNLEVVESVFDALEDGTAPTKFINVNTAFDKGLFSGNRFRFATNASATFTIGAGLLWMGNITEAGVSAARPA